MPCWPARGPTCVSLVVCGSTNRAMLRFFPYCTVLLSARQSIRSARLADNINRLSGRSALCSRGVYSQQPTQLPEEDSCAARFCAFAALIC